MILETKTKKVKLILKTRKIVEITNSFKGKNFEEIYMKAAQENNLEALAKIICLMAENEDGRNAFSNTEEVYDFIDEYKNETQKSYLDIFKEMAEVINNEGFFTKKMNKKELQEAISNPLSGVNMNELVQKSAEQAIMKVAEQEFKGIRA